MKLFKKIFNTTFLSLVFVIGAITIILGMMQNQPASQGLLKEHDKQNKPIVLEWYKYSEWSQQIIELQKQITPVIAWASAEALLVQLKKFQTLSEEEKESLDQEDREELSFFSNAQDSKAVKEKFIALRLDRLSELESKLVQENKELTQESKEVTSPNTETNYLVIAKEHNGTILGFAEFCIKPNYPAHSIGLEPLMVLPQAQGRGLASILIFSILKLNKNIKRIFLDTRKDNKKARAVYEHLGFKKYEENKDTIKYEYLVPSKEQAGVCDCRIL